MNADGTIQIYGPQRVDINPDGVKVPRIKAATPGEDEEELLNEFGESVEEFDIMGDANALGEVATLMTSTPAIPSASTADSATTSQFGAIANAATKSPENAPATVDMSNMQDDFQRQWDNSFPRGVSQEHGGIIVSDSRGNLSMTNEVAGDSGSIAYDFTTAPNQNVVGTFHTHPYDSTEGGHVGVAHSGADMSNMINDPNRHVSIVQSGDKQFMLMKTADTPQNVDSAALNETHTKRLGELRRAGHDLSEASRIATKEAAAQNGLAYYEGQGGMFSRIVP
jgi:hypothetical protein